VLYALLFLPAVLAIAFVLVRRRPVRVLAEAALPPATISGALDPMAELDALLVELEGATVRIDGADELDEHAVVELERLADRFEAAAASIGGSGETVAVSHGRAGRRAAASSGVPIAPLSGLPASLQSRHPSHPCNEHHSAKPS